MDFNIIMLIITLNVNNLNTSIRWRLSDYTETYFIIFLKLTLNIKTQIRASERKTYSIKHLSKETWDGYINIRKHSIQEKEYYQR